ncbi:MAG: nitroreductase family protein [Methanomicrobia archaeon]|nr:nitroreductase family protein [Methanomicrobia archaeon]
MSIGVIDLIRKRRSIRRFKRDFVRPEAIKVILDAGRWAPSAGNRQPWDFVVVSENEEKEPIAELYVDAYREEANDLLSRSDAEKLFKNPYEAKKRILSMLDLLRDQILKPPYLILVCADTELSRSYLFETGAAIQNMMLTASDMKLGACCIEIATTLLGEYFDKQRLKDGLGIPPEIEVVALVPIGKPEVIPPRPGRKILRDFTHTEFYLEDKHDRDDTLY